jgi:anti-sigma factor RsiW
MNETVCADMVDRLPDWVAGRLDASGAARVGAHVAVCARCAAEAELVRGLHAARPLAPAGLAARIADAARADVGRARGPAVRRRLAPAWALSAAAVLVLAVGTSVLMERSEPPVEPAPTEIAGLTVDDDAGVWIADDALVAGAPVLEELSDDDLAALLEEMGG